MTNRVPETRSKKLNNSWVPRWQISDRNNCRMTFRYTRNLVNEGNGKYNLMALCWGEGHGSAIHDHANSHCFMKMLQGSLEEIRFTWPEKASDELKEISRRRLNVNEVTYINGKLLLAFLIFNVNHEELIRKYEVPLKILSTTKTQSWNKICRAFTCNNVSICCRLPWYPSCGKRVQCRHCDKFAFILPSLQSMFSI